MTKITQFFKQITPPKSGDHKQATTDTISNACHKESKGKPNNDDDIVMIGIKKRKHNNNSESSTSLVLNHTSPSSNNNDIDTNNKIVIDSDNNNNQLSKEVNVLIESLIKRSSIQNNTIDSSLNNNCCWYDALLSHFYTPSFHNLATFIYNERKNNIPIYPIISNVWAALNVCSLNQVKVVIVGQDPYHNLNQAHGLSFSVLPEMKPLPPSLLNIYKEIINEYKQLDNESSSSSSNDTKTANNKSLYFNSRPEHGYLMKWAKQGILLLNAVMTVRKNQPNSHSKHGWEELTDEIIKIVMKYNQKSKGVVFLLWGKPAYQKAINVIHPPIGKSKKERMNKKSKVVTTTNNDALSDDTNMKNIVIISTSHPSPLGATKTNSPFIGSQCFSRCNDALIKMGHEPINWNV